MSTNAVRSESDVSKEKLIEDVRLVVSDAEELLRATAGVAGEKIAEARERIQGNLATAKVRLAAAEDQLIARTREAARATDEYVHDHAWQAAGVGAAVGVLIGMLIGRSR